MTKITLKQLSLENFKGIRQLTIEFDANQTSIHGDNGTGKTTVFDAFTWLLFGKNSRDEKDFGIKTLDGGKVVEKIDHAVTGVLLIDDTPVTLKRVYSEKWQRRRGAEEAEMTGHETNYFWDDVPVQAGDYAKRVAAILDEKVFKMITSATYFNSLDWKIRREILSALVGGIDNADIIAGVPKAQQKLAEQILSTSKSVDEQRKALAVKKKALNDELKDIQPRIDEVKRSMPDPVDVNVIKTDLYNLKAQLLQIDSAISDRTEATKQVNDQRQAKQNKAFELRKRASEIEFTANQRAMKQAGDDAILYQQMQGRLATLKWQIEQAQETIEREAAVIADHQTVLDGLRSEWTLANGMTLEFPEGDDTCPTCRQPLPDTDVATKRDVMRADFDKAKAAKLTSIRSSADRLKALIAASNERIEKQQQLIADLTTELAAIPDKPQPATATALPPDPQAAQLREQAAAIEATILEPPSIDVEGLKQQRLTISGEVDALNGRIAEQEQRIKAEARVAELLKQEKTLAQELSNLEKYEFAMNAIGKAHSDEIERRVNGRFKLVRWKLFDYQINGAVVETCEATVNGVPYSDLNSAAKIQAGIDCINTLTEHYGVFGPVFLDNAETVNKLPECTSQLVRLVVSKDKKLTIK